MIKCPICKTVLLNQSTYDNNLLVSECDTCGGAWLRANDYAAWLKTQKPGTFTLESSPAFKSLPIIDSNQAAACPDCGHLLRKYSVSANFDFHLDRCNNCNGTWLDRNEWQALKVADLHDEINKLFTQSWQNHIRDQITSQKFDEIYVFRFGKEDYARIKEIRSWLQDNPNRSTLIAFLLDKDPYKP